MVAAQQMSGEVRATPNRVERVLAAAAHVLLLFSLAGTAGAAAIWLVSRGRSPYVARQARQAVLWQILSNVMLAIMALVFIAIIVISFGSAIGGTQQRDTGAVLQFSGALLCLALLPFCATLYVVASAVLGALYALLGREYHYPLVNRRRSR